MNNDPDNTPKHLMILGSRGIPAQHGGFETFAENLALFLVRRGWQVSVYCQSPVGKPLHETTWQGVRLIHVPAGDDSPLATIWFDWQATLHAAKSPGVILTLGYNTAVFLAWYKLCGRLNLINMDGIEWRRSKWSLPARVWLYINERLACWFASHLIADNPGIKTHLEQRVPGSKISMIPYGAPSVETGDPSPLAKFGLESGRYVLLVARAEPENSVLEIVRAFARKKRGYKLAIVGKYNPEAVPYHQQVLESGSDEVLMLGPIYDQAVLRVLRLHACLYAHGHQVGGTNPSLVEALGAGNPVLAHDNEFNRWVAGDAGLYFDNEEACEQRLTALLGDDDRLKAMRVSARSRYQSHFQWPQVLKQYERLLEQWYAKQLVRSSGSTSVQS